MMAQATDQWSQLKQSLREAQRHIEGAMVACNEGNGNGVADELIKANNTLVSGLIQFREGDNG